MSLSTRNRSFLKWVSRQSTTLLLTIRLTTTRANKKLRYREEHSASVVLSWCTLWHFSEENLLMANQPLLRNWPRQLPNSAKWRKIMAVTPFKIIKGHRSWYQSKAHMRLPISDFQVMLDYMSNFASDRGASLWRLRWGWSRANTRINFTSPETRMIVLPDS